jgi:integrase
MYKTIEEIGLKKIRFHDLRHTHATILVENKANIKAVQERLGHSSIKTTLDTYTHVTNKAAKETSAILSDLLDE